MFVLNTSYYEKSANHLHAVSIAGKPPSWFTGKLAPKKWFFDKYKLDGDEEFYKRQSSKNGLQE